MKQGGPLRRHTPLKPKSAIKRTPMVHAAKQGSKTDFPAKVKEAVRRRSGGWCEFPRCTRAAVAFHHRLMRSQGGPGTAENCMHLCTSCHTFVHAHPAQSYEEGWLLRRPAS